MSTTVELVRANERYARLRAAVGALAAEWEAGGGFVAPNTRAALNVCAGDLRDLLAAVDS